MARRDALALGAAFLLLFGALFALSYPGTMTNDSIGWLYQARSGVYGGAQPIGAPLLWSLIDPVWPGPMGFVVFNLALLVGGLLVTLRLAFGSAVPAAVGSAAILFYPAVVTLLPVAWRDITGLGFTVATLALALLAARLVKLPSTSLETLAWLAASLLLLSFVGTLFRANHAAGALPILALPLAAFLIARLHCARAVAIVIALAASGLVLVGTTLSAYRVDAALSDREGLNEQAVMSYHLALISDGAGENLFPEDLYPDLTLGRIRELLDGRGNSYARVFWRAYSRGDRPELPRLETEEEVEVLRAAWGHAILDHPGIAAELKLREILGWLDPRVDFSGSSFVEHRVPPAATLIDMNFDYDKPEWSQQALRAWSSANGLIHNRHPVPLILLAFLAAAAAYRLKLPNRDLVLVGAFSALGHFLGVALVVALFPYRYAHQSNFFAILAVVVCLVDLYRARASGRRRYEHARAAADGRDA